MVLDVRNILVEHTLCAIGKDTKKDFPPKKLFRIFDATTSVIRLTLTFPHISSYPIVELFIFT